MSAAAAVSSQPDSETLRSAVTLEADLRPPTLAEPSSAPPPRLSHTADLIQRPQQVSRVFMLFFLIIVFRKFCCCDFCVSMLTSFSVKPLAGTQTH